MRYTPEHKEQSRDKILEAARGLFRRRGFEGASIDEVMNAAGLTRGAFYAHFVSKEDLISQVLGIEAGLVRALQRAADADQPQADALAALSAYLDPTQRINNATGCPLVAHPVDAIRGGGTRKDGYTDRLRTLIDSVEAVVRSDEPQHDAIVVSVLAIGGALLSAATADAQLADRIAQVCLDQVESIMQLQG